MEVSARNPVRLAIAIAATVLPILAVAAPAGEGTAWAASQEEPVEVKLLGSGDLFDDGAVVEVRALVRCEPTPPLLEALVTGSQDSNVGFGEGFFLGLTCDGRTRIQTARIQTFGEERFQRGKARVSAFVLLCDEVSGECFTGQDTRLVQLH
jgi:hypothetical protein